MLMVPTLRILAAAQMSMSGPLRFFWCSGVTWRLRSRHAGRARTTAPERTRAFGAAGQVNEGRTACLGSTSGQKCEAEKLAPRRLSGRPFEGTIPPPMACRRAPLAGAKERGTRVRTTRAASEAWPA